MEFVLGDRLEKVRRGKGGMHGLDQEGGHFTFGFGCTWRRAFNDIEQAWYSRQDFIIPVRWFCSVNLSWLERWKACHVFSVSKSHGFRPETLDHKYSISYCSLYRGLPSGKSTFMRISCSSLKLPCITLSVAWTLHNKSEGLWYLDTDLSDEPLQGIRDLLGESLS